MNGGYRQIAPQLVYTNHDYDAVLGLYYAKARFYDPEDKHFLSMDPVKGSITDPLTLTPYVYCMDNPLRWTDPLGKVPISVLNGIGRALSLNAMPHEAAFVSIMLVNKNWKFAGHQLAQAFTYKWLVENGYSAVELEHEFSSTKERADVIALKGHNLTIYELKHRRLPKLDVNNRSQYSRQVTEILNDVYKKLQEASSQLNRYYSALKCGLEQSAMPYTMYRGFPYTLAGYKEYKLFEYRLKERTREVFICLRGSYEGIIEYWFLSRSKKQQEREYELETYDLVRFYKEDEERERKYQNVYQTIAAMEAGLTVSIGFFVGSVVTGVVVGELLTPTVAAWVVSAPDITSAIIEKGGEIIFQFGPRLQEMFDSLAVPVPALSK